MALLIVPTIAAVLIWAQEPFARLHVFVHAASTYAALLWIGGMLGALVCLRRGPLRLPTFAMPKQPWLIVGQAVVLLLVLDVAAGLRLWRLGSLPEGIWFDEANFAASAQQILSMPFQPFGPNSIGHTPNLYFYVMAVVMKAAGTSIGPIRLTSAIFGTIAVLAIFLLGRNVGGFIFGISGALILAFSKWAIDFSRLGMVNMSTPAMISIAIFFLSIAMLRPRSQWFALTGLLLGIAMLTFAGAFIAGLVIAHAVVALRLCTDRDFRSAAWPGVLLLPIGFVVGAAPLLTALALDAGYTLQRVHEVSLLTEYSGWHDRLTALASNLRMHLLMFTIQGDANGRHNLPGSPMLDTVTGALFLLGLGMCLRGIRRWFPQVLLLWLGVSMLGGILTLDFEAPQGDRSLLAVAPVALIAALPLALCLCTALQRAKLGATWPSDNTNPSKRNSANHLVAAIAALGAMVSIGFVAHDNYSAYFVLQAHNLAAWSEMGGMQALVGRSALTLESEGYTVRISPDLVGDPALQLAANGQGLSSYDPNVPVPLPVPSGGLALIIPTTSTEVYAYVQRSYPSARVIPLTPAEIPSSVQARVVIVTRKDAESNVGATVTFGAGASSLTLRHLPGEAAWPASAGARTDVRYAATLVLGVDQAWLPLNFRMYGIRAGTITIDGATWPIGASGTPAVRLGAGNHAIVIDGRGRAGAMLGLRWRAASGSLAQGGIPGDWADISSQFIASPALPTGGLLGLYYPGPDITGQPVLQRVDQVLNTYYQNPPGSLSFPFSTQWLGSFTAATAGSYQFALDTTGRSTLFVDGRAVLSGGPSGNVQSISVPLTGGTHAIRLDYHAVGAYLHCYLTWAPPGQGILTPIPPTVTWPAHG